MTESNKAARRLYEQCGFTPTGERQPLPSDPSLMELAMARAVDLPATRPASQASGSRLPPCDV